MNLENQPFFEEIQVNAIPGTTNSLPSIAFLTVVSSWLWCIRLLVGVLNNKYRESGVTVLNSFKITYQKKLLTQAELYMNQSRGEQNYER